MKKLKVLKVQMDFLAISLNKLNEGIIEVNYEETILMKTSKVMSIIGIILFIMYVNMEEIKNILIDKSK